MKANDCIREALKTFEERNKVYGDCYLRHGEVMSVLFPNGVELNSVEDFNRFGILNMQISKLVRYTNGWRKPHIDSSHDLGVYSFMQEELDRAHHLENMRKYDSSIEKVSNLLKEMETK